MNMIDALQSLKDAGLIVDFKTDDAGSEYSVVFQSSVPNLELSELFDRVQRCTNGAMCRWHIPLIRRSRPPIRLSSMLRLA
jgi:hypothetical protein